MIFFIFNAHRRWINKAIGALGIALSACSSSPPHLYTLATVEGAVLKGAPSVVEVRKPIVAMRLDRDTIVLGDHGYQTVVSSGNSWSEPLSDMLANTLTSDLVQRLPGVSVYAQNELSSATPDIVIEVTFRHFEGDSEGHARIAGAFTVKGHNSNQNVLLQPFAWQGKLEQMHDTSYLVAQLSQGLGSLADHLAKHVQRLSTPSL